MSTQHLQPRSLCIAIADKLRQRILAHEWAPGASVQDAEIAAGYGVSRTPVREALKLLCHEGLLQAHPRRGMTVSMPSAAELREALALQQWLARFVREQESTLPDTSLARTMLRMADNRLQLRCLPGRAMHPAADAGTPSAQPLQPAAVLAAHLLSTRFRAA